MTRRRRPPIARAALAVLLLFAGGAAALPTPPSIPAIPLPPGSATAHFKVFVEGRMTATKNEDLGSSDGTTCTVQIHSTVEETTTFQRGKGVVLEFVRLGKGKRAPVIIQRAGRNRDASLILQARTKRTSLGSASRADPPGAPVSFCDPRVEDLTQGPDCGKIVTDTERASFLYSRPKPGIGLLRLALSPLAALPEIDCPVSVISPGLDSVLYAWPNPIKRNAMVVPISPARIFGTRRAIVETFDTGVLSDPPETVNLGSISGQRTNFGSNRVTIRLVRVP